VELISFPGTLDAIPFTGQLTLWEVDPENPGILRFLHAYSPDYKIQFAAFAGSKLLVYGSDRLEIFDHEFNLVATVRDRWMVGGHTVYPGGDGTAWVTAAPANAVLQVDLDQLQVVKRIRMPECYGRGMQLREEDDLHAHVIPTDIQPTHINSAVPYRKGLLVTFWNQGVVGHLGFDGSYREITRGFRGAHGGRPLAATGEVLLTDSPAGLLWFLDFESGTIHRRLQLDSRWVHDADFVDSDHLVTGLSDHNELRVIKAATGAEVSSIDCSPFGASVMFVNVCEVNDVWQRTLQNKKVVAIVPTGADDGLNLEDVPMPKLGELRSWSLVEGFGVELEVIIRSARALRHEYLLRSAPFLLRQGDYRFGAHLQCRLGELMLGLLDKRGNRWLANPAFNAINSKCAVNFSLSEDRMCELVLSAANASNATPVDTAVQSISLRRVVGEADGNKEVDFKQPESATALSWQWANPSILKEGAHALVLGTPVRYDYLLQSSKQMMRPGLYRLTAMVWCLSGRVVVGVLGPGSSGWIVQLEPSMNGGISLMDFEVKESGKYRVVVSANNADGPRPIQALIQGVFLQYISSRTSVRQSG